MKLQVFQILALGAMASVGGHVPVEASASVHAERAVTDAGRLEIPAKERFKYAGIYRQIKEINLVNGQIDFENGSRWSVSKPDAVKGWEKSKNLVITQNHALLSGPRYALVNLDLKLAEPMSLVHEPTPTKGDFVKGVDRVNDIITLSDNKRWIIHSSDRDKLAKMNENDRVIIGINTGSDQDKSPYLLIDTANNHFVRAQVIE